MMRRQACHNLHEWITACLEGMPRRGPHSITTLHLKVNRDAKDVDQEEDKGPHDSAKPFIQYFTRVARYRVEIQELRQGSEISSHAGGRFRLTIKCSQED